ncbi:uncharacterized protein ARMOST_02365 [Armillaria ostoyae]|uniref:Uncharacterized protein n=1 Tax=Armillaria ostoyae TaxID=47428 RepID=A0A284QRH3_ARMOS|nr:uncharacterized protein ARMOST_02365 [Armillaria ostoyae]
MMDVLGPSQLLLRITLRWPSEKNEIHPRAPYEVLPSPRKNVSQERTEEVFSVPAAFASPSNVFFDRARVNVQVWLGTILQAWFPSIVGELLRLC